MLELIILTLHLLCTIGKLLRPGGARAVAAESLVLKHQLLIMTRSNKRATSITSFDRILLGFITLFANMTPYTIY